MARRKCKQCKASVEWSGTGRPPTYCSRSCQNKAHRIREAAKNVKAVLSSETNEWYTPAVYIDAARRVLGGFDLDPASCAEANQIVQASRYFSEDDDGMGHDWKGRVWLNPPYGRLAGQFIVRCVEQYAAGNIAAAIILVNAHCTDTAWFRPLWDHTLCFTYGRLNFAAGTTSRGGSTHGSVFAYLGHDPQAFADEFTKFGAVVIRYG